MTMMTDDALDGGQPVVPGNPVHPDAAEIAAVDKIGAKPEADDMLSIPLDSGFFNLPERMMTAEDDESKLVPWSVLTGEQCGVILEMEVERQLAEKGDLDLESFIALYDMLSVAKDGRGREDAKAAAGSLGNAAAGGGGGGGFMGRLMGRRGGA